MIEAVQWTGRNLKELNNFIGLPLKDPESGKYWIPTLEGPMFVSVNDWIIKGIAGEFYPCKPDIFIKTYEGEDKAKNPYLKFYALPLEEGKKMYRYKVMNTVLNQDIGRIHWRGGWRQYVFRAHPAVDMARSCHKEIDNFIDELMKRWKEKLKKKGHK